MTPNSVLKNYFQTGAKPTESNFHDLIDELDRYSSSIQNLGSASSSFSIRTSTLESFFGGNFLASVPMEENPSAYGQDVLPIFSYVDGPFIIWETTSSYKNRIGISSDISSAISTRQPLSSVLTNIDLASNGIITKTGGGGAIERTIVGTAPISVANGNGVSGNPTISVSASTTSSFGVIQLATPAEVLSGSNNTKAVTPFSLSNIYLSRSGGIAYDNTGVVSVDFQQRRAADSSGTLSVDWLSRNLSNASGSVWKVSGSPILTEARYNIDSASFNSNINAIASSSGTFTLSSSLSDRVSKTESTGSNLITASASLSRYNIDSASFNSNIGSRVLTSTYTTNSSSWNSSISALTNASASLSRYNVDSGSINSNISSLQSSLSGKANIINPTFSGSVSLPQATTIGSVSATEIGYLGGVTSPIQTQLNNLTVNGGANNSSAFKNRLINGKMNVSQRGTTFNNVQNNAYTLDRWQFQSSYTGAINITQQADVPSNNEFLYSLRATIATSDSSIGSTEFCSINQPIEGFNVRDLISKTFTLSFWVKSSVAGTYCVSFKNSGNNRTYIADYTVISPNTWEFKTITVTGGLITDGTWDWTTGVGLRVGWTICAGSSFITTAGSWQTGNFHATSGQTNFVTSSVGSIFAITGAQLEVGSTSTIFDHLSYSSELNLCSRYYQFNLTSVAQSFLATTVTCAVTLAVPMRISPIVTIANGTTAIVDVGVAERNMTAFASYVNSIYGGYGDATTTSTTTPKVHLIKGGSLQASAEF